MNEKIIIKMGSQIISIEFGFSFPTIYHNVMYAHGKVPPKIMLLYGGISSYSKGLSGRRKNSEKLLQTIHFHLRRAFLYHEKLDLVH